MTDENDTKAPLPKPIRVVIAAAVALFVTPTAFFAKLSIEVIIAWVSLWIVVILGASFVLMREAFSAPKRKIEP